MLIAVQVTRLHRSALSFKSPAKLSQMSSHLLPLPFHLISHMWNGFPLSQSLKTKTALCTGCQDYSIVAAGALQSSLSRESCAASIYFPVLDQLHPMIGNCSWYLINAIRSMSTRLVIDTIIYHFHGISSISAISDKLVQLAQLMTSYFN